MAVAWTLRPATPEDRDFLFELNRAAMGPYVEATWGWDEDEQIALFDRRFDPSNRSVIVVDDTDIGVLAVDETEDEIRLLTIALVPAWQQRGIGSSVLQSLVARAVQSRRAMTLRVLHSNPRALALYEAVGFTRTGQSGTHVFMRLEPSASAFDSSPR